MRKHANGTTILTFAEFDELNESMMVEKIEDNGLSGAEKGYHYYTVYFINGTSEDVYTEETESE